MSNCVTAPDTKGDKIRSGRTGLQSRL